MIIPCFRCGKEIDTPDASNADYIIAEDTKVKELREALVAVKHNQETLEKKAADKPILDSEYDIVEVPDFETARAYGEDLIRIEVKMLEKDIQKTGIICSRCFRKTDFVIWGVHKKQG